MKVNFSNIGGKITKDNDTYRLIDNNHLEHLTLSKTELKPGQSTNGHSHDDLEEVYFFTKGFGKMQLGERTFEVSSQDVVLVPAGEFHRVFTVSNTPLEFVCVFEKYDRDSDTAKYSKITYPEFREKHYPKVEASINDYGDDDWATPSPPCNDVSDEDQNDIPFAD